jgi:hypothetical protein
MSETKIKELETKIEELENKIKQIKDRSEKIFSIVEEYILDLNINIRLKNLEEKVKKN